MDASVIQLSWSLTAICGIALVAFVIAIVASIVRSAGQRQRLSLESNRQRNAQDSELAITLQQTLLDLSVLDREVRWHSVRVAKIVQESVDVKSFYLVDAQSDTLPVFLPGQHLLLERPGGKISQVSYRCYSLSEDNDEGYWRITVKKVANHPTSVSRWLHEEVTEGDVLRVRGPSGAFYLRSSTARNAVFLSAGVGITPMVPMLLQAARRPHGSIHFLAQFRDPAHAPLAEQILAFGKRNESARVQLWFARFPESLTLANSRLIQKGKFTGSDVCKAIDVVEESDVYLCGPEGWLQKLKGELIACGVPEESIFFELFHSETDGKGRERDYYSDSLKPYKSKRRTGKWEIPPTSTPSQEVATQSCSVHFRSSNLIEDFSPETPNLLSLALKNSVLISSGCRTGACGSCVVRLLQGKVRYTRKPQYNLKPTEILPCVCVPEGDIVVDA